MATELRVPEVGESITEVQVGEWLKGVGDHVEQDETIVMIETDKVTVELPAPSAGVLREIRVEQGGAASVGDVIGLLDEVGAGAAASVTTPAAQAPPPLATTPAPPPVVEEAPPSSALDSIPAEGFARVMPAARRALAQAGLDASQVEATGPGRRLLKEDVEAHRPPSVPKSLPGGGGPAPVEPPRQVVSVGPREEDVVPMSPMRKRIAERLVAAQQNAALLTTFNEVDMSLVIRLRQRYQSRFLEKYGVKLGFMSFFVKAAIEALKLVPQVNAEVRESDIVYRNYFDIGVAVGGGRGLVVPVIRGADRLSFAEVELAIADYARRAADNKLTLDELQGGTFTISNGGVYGSLLSTPIVNPPQSGILGLHAMQDRAVVVDRQVVVRPMMYVALTYDHRVVDGREAVTFLKRVKECVEAPSRILLEV